MDRVIQHLIDEKEKLLTFLKAEIRRTNYDYETFGKKIEAPLLSEIITILEAGGFLTTRDRHRSIFHKSVLNLICKSDISVRRKKNAIKKLGSASLGVPRAYQIAENKNEFPDLTIFCQTDIALDIKAGNRSQYDKTTRAWRACPNSNNDLGTLNSWPDKLKKFYGEKIYFFFIEYDFTSKHQEIVDVKIDHFYKFIGLNEVNLLSYREKDGNLRTKNFDSASPVNSLAEFQQLLPPTIIYRSKQLIKKHIVNVPDGERNAFLDSLRV